MISRVRSGRCCKASTSTIRSAARTDVGFGGMVDCVGLLGRPAVGVTALGAKVVDDPSFGDTDDPSRQRSTIRVELLPAPPGAEEHVLCHFFGCLFVERLPADPVDQGTVRSVGLLEVRSTCSEGPVELAGRLARWSGRHAPMVSAASGRNPASLSECDGGVHERSDQRCRGAPVDRPAPPCLGTQPAGGSSTVSMTWMMPLLASTSTAITLASLTMTLSPST